MCNSELCASYDPSYPLNCAWHDAVTLDTSGNCDLFVLADDSFKWEEIAKEKYKIVEERRRLKNA